MQWIKAGDYQITALTDATPAPARCADAFPNADLTAHPNAATWFPNQQFETSFTIFLLRGPEGDILVDCGIGPTCAYFPGLTGQLPQALANAGTSLDQIKTVLLTHLHVDHVGWAPHLPHASFHVGAAEWTHWSPQGEAAGRAHHVEAVARCITPLGPRLLTDHPLPPGLAWLPAPGHTQGHQAILINNQVLIAGDAWHNPAQCEVPTWCHRADHTPSAATATRAALAHQAQRNAWIIAAGHFQHRFGRLDAALRFQRLPGDSIENM